MQRHAQRGECRDVEKEARHMERASWRCGIRRSLHQETTKPGPLGGFDDGRTFGASLFTPPVRAADSADIMRERPEKSRSPSAGHGWTGAGPRSRLPKRSSVQPAISRREARRVLPRSARTAG